MSAGAEHTDGDAVLDFDRTTRIGLTEAVFCKRKTPAQIAGIVDQFRAKGRPCLLTHLNRHKWSALAAALRSEMDYDLVSNTGILPAPPPVGPGPRVAIVSGGTSDAPVAREAARTLAFHGVGHQAYQDLGVTGLWRLLARIDDIRRHPVVIAVAGMEGALFSVLGGLVAAPVIAVPTSVGYGVSARGELALNAALGSCAPGLVTVNIDNGYGAACAALRMLRVAGGEWPATGLIAVEPHAK